MPSAKQIFRAYSYIFVILIYLPIISLLVLSFNSSPLVGYPIKAFGLEWNPSLKWWRFFFSDPIALSAIKNSLIAASATACLATSLGLGVAYVIGRRTFAGRRAILYSMLIPMSISYVVIGTGLLLMFYKFFGIRVSLRTLIIGHTLVALPYSSLCLLYTSPSPRD